MAKHTKIIAFNIFLTILILLYGTLVKYGDMPLDFGLARSIGFAISPWLIGIIIASIKCIFGKIFKHLTNFLRDFFWSTAVLLIILAIAQVVQGTPPQ